ncbi:BrnT family toxin [bacterium]|nr:BrnT family toxin [bacterium]MCI0614952.1 BrnT family toxin [bacterium]
MCDYEDFEECEGFDWDEANIDKNWKPHRVHFCVCEEGFFNEPLVVHRDEDHLLREKRFYALGKTNSGRRLFVVFTIRINLIRIISARDMTRSEKIAYKYHEKKDSGF